MAKAARSYYRAPVACLLHPPQQWPASLQVLKGAYGKPCISDGSLPLIACGLWGGGTALWDASNGRRLLSVHGSRPVPDKKADIRTAAFSPEPAHAQGHIHTQDRDASGGPTAGTAGSQQQQQPHWMVTLGDEGLWLWDVATAQEVASVQQGLHYPSCLAWAPDGQRFACVVSSKTREVVVWSIETPDPSVAAAGGSSSPVAALKEVMRLPHDAHEGHDAVENIGMAAVGWAHGGSILLTCSATGKPYIAPLCWLRPAPKPIFPRRFPTLLCSALSMDAFCHFCPACPPTTNSSPAAAPTAAHASQMARSGRGTLPLASPQGQPLPLPCLLASATPAVQGRAHGKQWSSFKEARSTWSPSTQASQQRAP